MIYGELRFGTLDIGYNTTDQWAALARVAIHSSPGPVVSAVRGS